MGRPAKTLPERVLAGSSRADRYGSLLAGELLPATSPFSDRRRRRIWQELRQAQREYQEAVETQAFSAEGNRAIAAGGFSKLVRTLPPAAGPLPGCGRSRLTLGSIAPGWSGSWRSERLGLLFDR
jgi:hypothetical protein